jgi:hypothetical protein
MIQTLLIRILLLNTTTSGTRRSPREEILLLLEMDLTRILRMTDYCA